MDVNPIVDLPFQFRNDLEFTVLTLYRKGYTTYVVEMTEEADKFSVSLGFTGPNRSPKEKVYDFPKMGFGSPEEAKTMEAVVARKAVAINAFIQQTIDRFTGGRHLAIAR